MTLQISLIIFLHLLVPFVLVAWLIRGSFQSKFDWLMGVLVSGAFIALIFVAGMWAFVSYYARFMVVCLFALAVLWSVRTVKVLPFFVIKNTGEKIKRGIIIVVTCLLMFLVVLSGRGTSSPDPSLDLEFPLRHGTFYVLQGGNNQVTNFFHTVNPVQQYALDIVKLNHFGMLGRGIFPTDLSRHEIFGDTVYAPMRGIIAEAADSLSDLEPPLRDLSHPVGNHVVIDSAGIRIVLAHLLNRSVAVRAGEPVRRGEIIGRVGNSGNTSLPHLHIHAEKSGGGAPIRFAGRTFSMNDVFTLK